MNTRIIRARTAFAALIVGLASLLALPTFSSGGSLVDGTADRVGGTVDRVVGGASSVGSSVTGGGAPAAPGGVAAPAPASGPVVGAPAAHVPPSYQPPLHGTSPHGEGTVITEDLNPLGERPLGEETDGSDSDEDAVVGRSRGQQNEDGSYSGKVETVALLGNSIGPTNETEEGESRETGPVDLCPDPDSFCLQALTTSSETDERGSENSFTAAFASVGGDDGVVVTAAESEGNIRETRNCQRSEGSSGVATAELGGTQLASAGESSSSSRACNDGTETQENDSSVLVLLGTPLPLPVDGCDDGTPNSSFAIPLLLTAICNADDSNGDQAGDPYGVREALTAFVGVVPNQAALSKTTLAASESRAQAPEDGDGTPDPDPPNGDPPGDGGPPTTSGGPPSDGGPPTTSGGPGDPGGPDRRDDPSDADDFAECEDGIDNDGDGLIDFPDDPDCESPSDDSESAGALPFTGANVIGFIAIGALLVAGGAAFRRTEAHAHA